MTRRFIRDRNGRFASTAGSGMVSGKRKPRPKPKGGTMARTLRQSIEGLKEGDRRMSMAMTGRAAGPILSRGRRAPAVKLPKGTVTNALGSTLRQLAQSDARMYRELADIAKPKPKRMGGSKGRKRLKGG